MNKIITIFKEFVKFILKLLFDIRTDEINLVTSDGNKLITSDGKKYLLRRGINGNISK